jgi:signal transduction histidine kinase/phage shock protein PspC (stress-responsive transcriptional regulator)
VSARNRTATSVGSAQRAVARLHRQRTGRLVAGVSAGIAEHLGIPVLWVRAVFAVLAAFGGAGIAAYGLLWVFVPQQPDTHRPVSGKERQQGIGLILLGIGLAVGVGSIGGIPAWLAGPLGVALVGAAVVWREADESQRRRWRQGARTGVAGVLLDGGGRAAAVRILGGVALVVAGIVVFLAGKTTVSDLQFALLAVFSALAGAAVLTIPWWVRLLRDLNLERASRIRSQERAEIAAHLHDSVLQTLALIQKQADTSREVRRLARGQERELRTWLYGPSGYGRTNGAGRGDDDSASVTTLADELAQACGEVEDAFAIKVQQVTVGDCELDEPLAALLAAAREAVVNAAKHAGVGEVSVYSEVADERVEIYVRDRGAGFDPDSVRADRHGLADSIRGRMERNGGRVRVRTAPGAGTEVQMEMPRAVRS